jgi:hypothetical protein
LVISQTTRLFARAVPSDREKIARSSTASAPRSFTIRIDDHLNADDEVEPMDPLLRFLGNDSELGNEITA